MELRVLRYFLAVTREESITGAAQSLHVTQPTLSKQLMDLEEELGRKLFLRGSRKITLTEDGMFFRKRAQEIVDLVEKAQAEFSTLDEVESGDVYIGGGETRAMGLIAQTVRRLHDTYPGIRYHLYSGNGEDVAERLDKGLLDFGLFVGLIDFKKYDYLKLPMQDTWGLVIREDDHLARLDAIRPEDLAGVPILCSRQALIQNELSGWLGYDFGKLNIIATYNLIYNASLMVREGLGCALCIDGLLNVFGTQGLCFRPFEPRVTADLAIAWKKYQVFSRAAKTFLNALQEDLATHL